MPVMLALIFGVLGLIFNSIETWLGMLLMGLFSGYALGKALENARETEKLRGRLDEHRQKILELLNRDEESIKASPRPPTVPASPAAPEVQTSVDVAVSKPIDEPSGVSIDSIREEADRLAAALERRDNDNKRAPAEPAASIATGSMAATGPTIAAPLPSAATPPVADASSGLPGPLQWLLQGNPVAKVGVLLLFFGLSYLFKFAADRDLFPIELRLGGAALLATALLSVGWRLRHRQPLFGLLLQGASAGSLYLTIFAAFRLYQLIPQSLAFALMLMVCASSVMLAILQRAQSLAVAASLGGFLAPLLLSSGQGSHIGLFSYYLLLSGGILAVSLFQSWRSLNLIGFFFTFGVAGFWGIARYQPGMYWECQLFLIAFLLIYGVIAILFALRQTTELKGFVDGTLVFGTPLIGFGLQYGLTRHWTFGPAFSALAFAAFYLPLALWVVRKRPHAGRLLAQAFMALGLAFLTLAIPLGLDARWTALAWALEGAGLIWVGFIQGQRRMLWSGMALELAACFAMLRFFTHAPSLIAAATCGMVLAGAWLASAYLIARPRAEAEDWPERQPFYLALLGGGIAWWSLTALWCAFEATHDHPALLNRTPLYLALMTGSVAAWHHLSNRARWPDLGRAAWLLWPALALAWSIDDATHPLHGWNWLMWPLAIGMGLFLLERREGGEVRPLRTALHTTVVWLTSALAFTECLWRVDQLFLFAEEWRAIAYLALPAVFVGLVVYAYNRRFWPFAQHARAYLLFGLLPSIVLMVAGLIYANVHDGWVRELGVYIPLLNPLELSAAAALLSLLVWKRTIGAYSGFSVPTLYTTAALGALAFWWGNGILLRLLAEASELVWNGTNLWNSRLVQTSLALAWTATALAIMWLSARSARRILWLIGAGLLAAVVLKLFLIDSAASGGLARAVAFIGVALLLLLIGYVAPLPPRAEPR